MKVKESLTHINNLLLSSRDPPLETSLNFLRMTGMFLQIKFFLIEHMSISKANFRAMWSTPSESDQNLLHMKRYQQYAVPPAPQLLLQDSLSQSVELDVLHHKHHHRPAGVNQQLT